MPSHQKQTLLKDRRGNVAVIWAFALLPIMAVIGLTLDTQIAFSKKDRVQLALDSAVLAGARMLQSSNSKGKGRKHSEDYFDSLVIDTAGLTCEPVQISYPEEEEVRADVRCFQDTTLSGIIGRSQLEFNVSSTATYGVGKLDVAFVFDISGSMNSYGRLADLKVAATDAVTTLLPLPGASGAGDVRIAMASYNGMVDAGPYFEDVTGLKERRTYTATRTENVEECEWVCRFAIGSYCLSWRNQCDWVPRATTRTKVVDSTCVYERDGDHNFDDEQPTVQRTSDLVDTLPAGQRRATTDAENVDGYLSAAYAEYNSYNDSWNVIGDDCLNVEPMELNDNAVQIALYIQRLYASGGTAGHQGIAWGWYLISPEWDGVFDHNAKPLPYNEPDTTKAMIIMTDGEFNNHLYGSQGNSTEQARALCDSIKEKGVVIFTIAFQAPKSGEDVLSYCASSTEHAFKASNGAELKASYQSIATSISDLRIKS